MEEFSRKYIKDSSEMPEDAVILFEDELSIDLSHNSGYE